MGGYVTSASPESLAHVPPPSANKGFAAVNVPSQAQFPFSLPTWLTPSSQLFPHFYRQVWKLVEQDKGLVDTTRVFPLLLTSGLPTDVLGFIWGLANREVAGQLTEQELYIVLALVALAQVSAVSIVINKHNAFMYGAHGSAAVKALCYKLEGSGFETR
jgi:hypothetical protein